MPRTVTYRYGVGGWLGKATVPRSVSHTQVRGGDGGATAPRSVSLSHTHMWGKVEY